MSDGSKWIEIASRSNDDTMRNSSWVLHVDAPFNIEVAHRKAKRGEGFVATRFADGFQTFCFMPRRNHHAR